MRGVTRVLTGLAVVTLLGGGYAAADTLDLVPGVLTLAHPVGQDLAPLPQVSVPAEPAAGSGTAASGEPSGGWAALTDPVRRSLGGLLRDPRLGPAPAFFVADAASGHGLLEQAAREPRTPASLAKLLTVQAVVASVDLDDTLATSLTLVGASTLELGVDGDTYVAPGPGDPMSVPGRAGLADLARLAKRELLPRGGEVTLRPRLGPALPLIPQAWEKEDVDYGFARPVALTGLSTDQLKFEWKPSSADPEGDVVKALVKALADEGISAQVAPRAEWHQPATGAVPGAGSGAGRTVRVESATVRELLQYGLAMSDNALLETQARRTMLATGANPAGDGATGAWVTATLKRLGVDTAGFALRDGAGLARRQKATASAIGQVLLRGSTGKDPAMAAVVAGLPVSGLDGTLDERFAAPAVTGVRGVVRAKTGTLLGISGLAGTTTIPSGRGVVFVVIGDSLTQGTDKARAALDEAAAALTRCPTCP